MAELTVGLCSRISEATRAQLVALATDGRTMRQVIEAAIQEYAARREKRIAEPAE